MVHLLVELDRIGRMTGPSSICVLLASEEELKELEGIGDVEAEAILKLTTRRVRVDARELPESTGIEEDVWDTWVKEGKVSLQVEVESLSVPEYADVLLREFERVCDSLELLRRDRENLQIENSILDGRC